MTWAEALQNAYKTTLLDTFLLENAERTAKSYPAAESQRIRELFRAGTGRFDAAADLLESQPSAAVVLLREAAILYIEAILASRGENIDLRPGSVAQAFELLETSRPQLSPPPAEADRAQKLLISEDLLAVDRLTENDVALGVHSIATTVTWLREAIEPRTVRQIRVSRFVRLGLAVGALLGLLAWVGVLIFSPKNIALHKPVTVSSVHPNSTAPQGGLTDGNNTGGYGVHTNKEGDPWVNVDLLDVYKLSKIKIYNRGDGWFDDDLPLTLELSANGTDFEVVDHRTTSFGQWSPWTFSPAGKKARYIRVHGAKGSFVALSELEAFGKK